MSDAAAEPSYKLPLEIGPYRVTYHYETTEYKCFHVAEGGVLVGFLRVVWTGREVFTPHQRVSARREEIHGAISEAVASRCFA
ncbi:MAG TPA: hypothetical protein VFR37_05380 [Longimicrobium sp.]|nr:hypothetical protein [Longimicrobium sp.]